MEAIVQNKDGIGTEVLVGDAYERVKADHTALKPEELIAVNLDIAAAVSTVLGVLPEVKALRDRMAKELPSFDVAAFDKLEDHANAARRAPGARACASRARHAPHSSAPASSFCALHPRAVRPGHGVTATRVVPRAHGFALSPTWLHSSIGVAVCQ